MTEKKKIVIDEIDDGGPAFPFGQVSEAPTLGRAVCLAWLAWKGVG